MAAIQYRKMNWVRDPSAWQSTQQWKAKRAAARQKYEAQATAFVNGLSAAWSNQSIGLGNITLQVAADRIQAASTAKRSELQNSLNTLA
jgi:hypothetical protein